MTDQDENYNNPMSENQEVLEAVNQLEEHLDKVDSPVGMHIALFDIYSEMENMLDAGQALTQAAMMVEPGDTHEDLIYFLYNQLELFAQLNPEAQAAYERLGYFISQDDGSLQADTEYLDQRKLYQVDLIPEILLANHLHRSRAISDPEFALALQDICWLTSRAPESPRSTLYALADRDMPHQDSAVEFVAHDASAPFIDLELMDTPQECYELLPFDFCIRRAACVFGKVGGEPLVAMLNPFNLQLKEDISSLLNCDPHFFVTSPVAYQGFLERQYAATSS